MGRRTTSTCFAPVGCKAHIFSFANVQQRETSPASGEPCQNCVSSEDERSKDLVLLKSVEAFPHHLHADYNRLMPMTPQNVRNKLPKKLPITKSIQARNVVDKIVPGPVRCCVASWRGRAHLREGGAEEASLNIRVAACPHRRVDLRGQRRIIQSGPPAPSLAQGQRPSR